MLDFKMAPLTQFESYNPKPTVHEVFKMEVLMNLLLPSSGQR